MKSKIKDVATRLIVQRGYHGLNFEDIAQELQITRANIHYHYGNKASMVEEVLDIYMRATLVRYQAIWTDPNTSLREKVAGTLRFNRERYDFFNSGKDDGGPWSLMLRLRTDSDVLSPNIVAILAKASHDFELLVGIGVEMALRSGELREDSPRTEVQLLFSNIILYASSITGDARRFGRLEEVFGATLNAVEKAYGTDRASAAAAPKRTTTKKSAKR